LMRPNSEKNRKFRKEVIAVRSQGNV